MHLLKPGSLVLTGLVSFLHVVPAVAVPQPLGPNYGSAQLNWSESGEFHWLAAEVNGVPANLLLDTGAAYPLYIARAHAERVGVTLGRRTSLAGFDGTPLYAAYGVADRVRLGSVTYRRLETLVLDASEFTDRLEKKAGVKLHGLVGAPLLKRYRGVLDYRHDTLYLSNRDEIDLRRMQGSWVAVDCVFAGSRQTDRKQLDATRLDVSDDRMAVTADGTEYRGRVALNAGGPIGRFQYYTVTRNGIEVEGGIPGLYQITQDQLIVAIPMARIATADTLPSRLESTAENSMCLWAFVRYPLPVAPAPREKLLFMPPPIPLPDGIKGSR